MHRARSYTCQDRIVEDMALENSEKSYKMRMNGHEKLYSCPPTVPIATYSISFNMRLVFRNTAVTDDLVYA